MNYGNMDNDFTVARRISCGIPLEEPYLQYRLSVLMKEQKKSLKGGKIYIPECYYLMGTTDPTGKLESDQVCIFLYVLLLEYICLLISICVNIFQHIAEKFYFRFSLTIEVSYFIYFLFFAQWYFQSKWTSFRTGISLPSPRFTLWWHSCSKGYLYRGTWILCWKRQVRNILLQKRSKINCWRDSWSRFWWRYLLGFKKPWGLAFTFKFV